MTATLGTSSAATDRSARSSAQRAAAKPSGPSGPFATRRTELWATWWLMAFSVAVAVGFARVFSGWDYFDNMLLLIVVGHGVGFLLRSGTRTRRDGQLRPAVPALISIVLSAVLLAWLVLISAYRPTLGSFLMPTADTWTVLDSEFRLVREQFPIAVAPVPFDLGWDMLGLVGIAAAVLIADAFAFRAFARAEALVPGGVLFVFVSALGDDRLRVTSAMLVVGTGVAATIALRSHHRASTGRGVALGLGRGRARGGRAGAGVFTIAAVGAIVGLIAGFVGPRLPGADSDPLYETKGGRGGVTEVISPLVDIRSRLTNQSNAEMFRVEATQGTYWRSSALIEFDGTRWGLPDRDLVPATGTLTEVQTRAEQVVQRIVITDLGGPLIPIAADPLTVTPADGNASGAVRWNPESSTLVAIDGDLAEGDVFDAVSAVPLFDPATLQRASSSVPGDEIYVALPDDFPTSVRQLAAEVTAGAATPYEQARVLQDWFQTEFDYSLEVQPGHGDNAMEAFLRSRVGYCEQFAGTYAAMLRSLGLPTRVAVGFTSGNEVQPGVFSVLGKNAHAWPEVWFDGLGWVPFEPTPGRGAPGAEVYTGLPAQQDSSGVDPDAPREDPDEETPTTTVPPGGNTDTGLSLDDLLDLNETPLLDDAIPPVDPGAGAAAAGSDDGNALTILAVIAGLAALAALPAVARRLRRRSPSTDVAHLRRTWERARVALDDVGIAPSTGATPREIAARTTQRFPIAGQPTTYLANAITVATYRPADAGPTLTTDDAQNWERWCEEIEQATKGLVPTGTRIRRHFTTWR